MEGRKMLLAVLMHLMPLALAYPNSTKDFGQNQSALRGVQVSSGTLKMENVSVIGFANGGLPHPKGTAKGTASTPTGLDLEALEEAVTTDAFGTFETLAKSSRQVEANLANGQVSSEDLALIAAQAGFGLVTGLANIVNPMLGLTLAFGGSFFFGLLGAKGEEPDLGQQVYMRIMEKLPGMIRTEFLQNKLHDTSNKILKQVKFEDEYAAQEMNNLDRRPENAFHRMQAYSQLEADVFGGCLLGSPRCQAWQEEGMVVIALQYAVLHLASIQERQIATLLAGENHGYNASTKLYSEKAGKYSLVLRQSFDWYKNARTSWTGEEIPECPKQISKFLGRCKVECTRSFRDPYANFFENFAAKSPACHGGRAQKQDWKANLFFGTWRKCCPESWSHWRCRIYISTLKCEYCDEGYKTEIDNWKNKSKTCVQEYTKGVNARLDKIEQMVKSFEENYGQ